MWGDIALIFLFILIGGVFAAAEMSLVSLRDAQVRQLSGRGKRGATLARLTADPNRFLSAVQIGVTLSGFLSAAFGGATLANSFAPVLVSWGLSKSAAAPVALVLITVVISYFSIVLGELASKRLAMQRAESFAMVLAPMVDAIAKLTRPVIWFLGVSTNVVVRLLGGDPDAGKEEVTEEEIRALVTTSESLGHEERRIVHEVFSAGERTLRELMVPRTEVDFLSGDMPAYKAIREVQDSPHSRYPVKADSVDEIVGFVHVRDLMGLESASRQTKLSQLARPVLNLPDTVKMMLALAEMRRGHAHLAIVRDEYGGTAGIVTLEDLVEELIGDITDEYDELSEADLHSATDVDGLLTLEEFAEKTGFTLPEGPYDTVAGFFMANSGQLPSVGDQLTLPLYPVAAPADTIPTLFQFRVLETDGRRAAWLSVRRPKGSAEVDATGAPVPKPADMATKLPLDE